MSQVWPSPAVLRKKGPRAIQGPELWKQAEPASLSARGAPPRGAHADKSSPPPPAPPPHTGCQRRLPRPHTPAGDLLLCTVFRTVGPRFEAISSRAGSVGSPRTPELTAPLGGAEFSSECPAPCGPHGEGQGREGRGEAVRIGEEGKEKQNRRQCQRGEVRQQAGHACARWRRTKDRGGDGTGGDGLASVLYSGGNGDPRGWPSRTRGRLPGASRLGRWFSFLPARNQFHSKHLQGSRE